MTVDEQGALETAKMVIRKAERMAEGRPGLAWGIAERLARDLGPSVTAALPRAEVDLARDAEGDQPTP